jgi:hypothetical protein
LAPAVPVVLAVLLAALLTVAAERPANATRSIFVWFADGGLPPPSAKKICTGRPPAFQCRLGPSVDDCRAPVLALLDRWYADFDVVFTLVPPAPDAGADAGVLATDTVVVSSDGAWCGADAQTVSRSPLPPCTDPGGGGAVAIFRCEDARTCATLIAKEQGHLVGLQHTGSPTDVMNELGGVDHDGFEDRDNLSAAPRCGRLQNSHQLMLTRLGAWPGGPKPGPGTAPPPQLPGTADADPPAPGDSGPMPEDVSSAEAGTPIGGRDAGVSGAADASTSGGDGGGCSCQLQSTPPEPSMALGSTVVALVLAGQTWRRRRVLARAAPGNRGPNQA